MTTTITLPESRELVELEKTITAGRDSWIAAGKALIRIRDGRLYRSDYKTFEDYCEKKWGWKPRNAQYLISSVKLLGEMPEVQNFAPSASTVREIGKAPADKRTQVVEAAASKAASESRPMTAADVREARVEVCEEERPQVRTSAEVLAEQAFGNLKATRVIKSFDAWLSMNFPKQDERGWVLGLLAEHIKDLNQ